MTLWEIGNKYQQYFNEQATNAALCQKAITIAEKSREKYKGDEFLPEILSFQITVLRLRKEFDLVKKYAEEFMVTYPDYRMLSSVEDAYREALDALKNKD